MVSTRSSKRREKLSELVVELTLFLCSYAALFAILAIRFTTTALTIACAALAALGVLGGLVVLLRFRSVAASTWTLHTVEDRGGEVAGYLATYLLPFVTVAEPGWRDIVAYVLFLAILAVIYVRSGLIQINPTLYLFGWRLYAIEIGDQWSGYVVARGRLAHDQELRAVRMTDRLFVSYARDGSDGG